MIECTYILKDNGFYGWVYPDGSEVTDPDHLSQLYDDAFSKPGVLEFARQSREQWLRETTELEELLKR